MAERMRKHVPAWTLNQVAAMRRSGMRVSPKLSPHRMRTDAMQPMLALPLHATLQPGTHDGIDDKHPGAVERANTGHKCDAKSASDCGSQRTKAQVLKPTRLD
jgi:hypothetical protein